MPRSKSCKMSLALSWFQRDLMCELVGVQRNVFLDSLRELIYEHVGKHKERLDCIES